MNIVDYIMVVILILGAYRGYKSGLISSIIDLVGLFLVFVLAFYLKNPISIFFYEKLPFLNFGGIFQGIMAANILFYEALAYGICVLLLGIVFGIIKMLSKALDKLIRMTIFLNLPCRLLAAVVGILQSILLCFILLYVASVINTTTSYVRESKYGMVVLKNIPVLSDTADELISSGEEIYEVLKNEKDNSKANLESIDILMKYNILSYDSANKLIENGKLNILNIETIVEKYKENNND